MRRYACLQNESDIADAIEQGVWEPREAYFITSKIGPGQVKATLMSHVVPTMGMCMLTHTLRAPAASYPIRQQPSAAPTCAPASASVCCSGVVAAAVPQGTRCQQEGRTAERACALGCAQQGTEKAQLACEEILARLRVDYLDLLLIHWPGVAKLDTKSARNAVKRLETWRVLEDFYRRGALRDGSRACRAVPARCSMPACEGPSSAAGR